MDADRDRLIELRDALHVAMQDASNRDLPALSREYRVVLKTLSELPESKQVSRVDEIAQRRARRPASSA